GECRRQRRYGCLRRREHPALVVQTRQAALSRRNLPDHHCRLRWQQRASVEAVEARTPAPRQRDRPEDHGDTPAAWHQQVEPDRAPFAFITMNWRSKPLLSHQVIVQLIGATTTETGLKVCCEIDGSLYPKGVKVSANEIQDINNLT